MSQTRETEILSKIRVLRKQLIEEQQLQKECNKVIEKTSIKDLCCVTNRLPIKLKKIPSTGEYTVYPSSGGLVSALTSLSFNMKWIGCIESDIPPNDETKVRNILSKYNCIPVFIPKEIMNKYYNGLSNDVVWPLFHYVPARLKTITDISELWYAYEEANIRFCSVVMQNTTIKDTIWVHDYHLMLLPHLLRKERPNCKLGWFLHTPFPSSEIYRTFPYRIEILESLLDCNLLGFHIHNYVRHFKASCSELLGCESTSTTVELNGKITKVGTFPIGIDPEKFKRVIKTNKFETEIERLRNMFGNAKIIVGVDRLDYVKGIPHKLLALEKFFSDNSEWVDKVTLVQIAVPTRTNVKQYQKLANSVHEMVGRINGRFSNLTHAPIHYMDRCIPFETLVALYCIADVCLITSLRDGMNLVSYEYIASQKEDDIGVLVLSEFVGAAQGLGAGSIQINPWNIDETASAIRHALSLDIEKKKELFKFSQQYINDHNSESWGIDFVTSIHESWKNTNFCKLPKNPTHLNFENVKDAFLHSKKRIILLDIIGTLTENRVSGTTYEKYLDYVKVRSSNLESLMKLTSDKDTIVVIATSRSKDFVDKVINNSGSFYCAEDGFYYKDKNSKEWKTDIINVDLTWMESVKKVMLQFVEMTPLSFIETQETSIKWNYCDCADEFGEKQAIQLVNTLNSGVLLNTVTEVVHSQYKKTVIAKLLGLNKSFAFSRFFNFYKNNKECSKNKNNSMLDSCFILCVGNYCSNDEDVYSDMKTNNIFHSYHKFCNGVNYDENKKSGNEIEECFHSNKKIFTVTVGFKKSLAEYYVNDSNELEKLLRILTNSAYDAVKLQTINKKKDERKN